MNESFCLKIAVLGLAAYGALKVLKTGVKSTKGLMKYFVWPRKDLKARYGEGSWALITGASDGIGK